MPVEALFVAGRKFGGRRKRRRVLDLDEAGHLVLHVAVEVAHGVDRGNELVVARIEVDRGERTLYFQSLDRLDSGADLCGQLVGDVLRAASGLELSHVASVEAVEPVVGLEDAGGACAVDVLDGLVGSHGRRGHVLAITREVERREELAVGGVHADIRTERNFFVVGAFQHAVLIAVAQRDAAVVVFAAHRHTQVVVVHRCDAEVAEVVVHGHFLARNVFFAVAVVILDLAVVEEHFLFQVEPFEHFHRLGQRRGLLQGETAVVAHFKLARAFARLGRDEYDAGSCTVTVNGRRRGVFQHRHRLDVLGVDLVDVALDTVDQHQRLVVVGDGRHAADADRTLVLSRLSRVLDHVDTRDRTLQGHRGLGDGAVFEVLDRYVFGRSQQVDFLLCAVTHLYDLNGVEHLLVGHQFDDVEFGLGVVGFQFERFVAHEREGDLALGPRNLDRIRAFAAGDRSSTRFLHVHGDARHGFVVLVVHYTLDLPGLCHGCRDREKHHQGHVDFFHRF